MEVTRRRVAGFFADDDGDRFTITPIYPETHEWLAAMEWLRFHGIDPLTIPAETYVIRDAPNRRILFNVYDLDGYGMVRIGSDGYPIIREAVEQGEAPPLPMPF